MMNEPDSPSGPPNANDGCAEIRARWNSYRVRIGLGVLSWFAFGLVNQRLGIYTALASASSVCALPVMGSEDVNPLTFTHGAGVAALARFRGFATGVAPLPAPVPGEESEL
jgi:hypothetical protein